MSAPVLSRFEASIDPTLSLAAYHKRQEWGSSSLEAMRRGPPARVIWERENSSDHTAATLLGSLVHALVLAPEELRGYVRKPTDMSFATKEGKAWRDSVPSGREIVPAETWDLAESIADSLRSHPLVEESLRRALHREVSIFWSCPKSGEPCKARPDWISQRRILDLKVSRHADSPALALRAYMEGWMHQLAHYRTGAMQAGLDVTGGRLVVVSPNAPHFVHTLEVKQDALDMLELENLATLEAMAECARSGSWPGVPQTWRLVEPPPTALPEFGEVSFDGAEQAEEEI